MVVIDLTKDGFIANVGDFEANPKEWKYIGSRPCLIVFHAPVVLNLLCRFQKNHQKTYLLLE